jgi:hypothetical protein
VEAAGLTDELARLRALLPDEEQFWLCVVFGSAARDAFGPKSDIDVLAEGEPEAVSRWAEAAEAAVGREVNPASVPYMQRQPMMMAEILEAPVVLRDVRGQVDQLRAEEERSGRLEAWLFRMYREALGDFDEPAPARAFTGSERRFMEALAKLRNERGKLTGKPLERRWAAQRITRVTRNLLRDWPRHGNYRDPAAAAVTVAAELEGPLSSLLPSLPYEQAQSNPVDVRPSPTWEGVAQRLLPLLDQLIDAASDALRSSVRA